MTLYRAAGTGAGSPAERARPLALGMHGAAATTPADHFFHARGGDVRRAHDSFYSRGQHQRRWMSASPKDGAAVAAAGPSLSSLEREAESSRSRLASPSSASAIAALRTNLGLYAELSKARLSSLVVITAGAGYAAAGGEMDYTTMAALCGGTSLAAGSAGTFNQIIERNRDKLMKRTCNRALPAGRISFNHATGWGVFSGLTSTAILAAGTNPVTTALGVANIGIYAIPYTLSKPHSEINTWIGAVVGAIPPVMGWCAAGGSMFDVEAALLGGTLFLWQFPHFFSLAWIHRKDYARGHHQMVPVNDPTGERTARLITGYSLAMFTIPLGATALDVTSSMFALEGVAATGYLTYLATKFQQQRSDENARKVFKCSLWYLPLMLALFVFHRKYGAALEGEAAAGEEGAPAGQYSTVAKSTKTAPAAPVWLEQAKEFMKGLCVHERIIVKNDAGALCPSTSPIDTKGANTMENQRA